jgi:hypothetical protein
VNKAQEFLDFVNEGKPVGSEGALKYVFKFPSSGSFTAEFDDGKKASFDNVEDLKSAGKYAFVGKGGQVFQTWDSKPSADAAAEVLRRAKFHGGE